MRALTIQVQPERSPGIDTLAVQTAAIAADSSLVAHHPFDHGVDKGPYFNFTFGTDKVRDLWERVLREVYDGVELGPHVRRASMAMCSGDEGWDDCVLLFHFDPTLPVVPPAAPGPEAP